MHSWRLGGGNVGVICWTFYSHGILTVVKLKGLLGNGCNPAIEIVESLFPVVDVIDDPIVDINVGIFSLLDGDQRTVKQLHLMHFITVDADMRLLKPTRLLPDLAESSGVVLLLLGGIVIHILNFYKFLIINMYT